MGDKTAKQLADLAEKAGREADKLAGQLKHAKLLEAAALAQEAARKLAEERGKQD